MPCEGEACSIRPITELWTGARWKLEPLPLPAGAAAGNPVLTAVSWSPRRFCVAVGGYALGSGCATPGEGACNPSTIAERWDGQRWYEMSTPRGVGALSAVSCASSTACTAVSRATDCIAELNAASACLGLGGAVIAGWNGRGWSLESTPTVPRAVHPPILSAVSCASAQACTAVGSYLQSATSMFAPLAEG